jgi:hypothetical protein
MVVGVQTSRKVAEEEPAKDAAAATPATPAAGADAKPAADEKGKEKEKK